MMTLITTAFFMGALGSSHCIGMCGPIALAIPAINQNPFSKFLGGLLYNLGRIVTYSILGSILGSIGQTLAIAGLQQTVSVLLGISILLFIFFPKKKLITLENKKLFSFFKIVREKITYLFLQRNYQSVFLIGLLNGLLPCGLIYMAIAGALATGSVLHSTIFMAAFGLGTLPLMWAVAFFGSFITLQTRKVLKKIYPVAIGIMGCMLVLRGLGLHIPYISHTAAQHTTSGAVQCSK